MIKKSTANKEGVVYCVWFHETNKNNKVLPVMQEEKKKRHVKVKFFVLSIYKIKEECLFMGEGSDLEKEWNRLNLSLKLVSGRLTGHWWCL